MEYYFTFNWMFSKTPWSSLMCLYIYSHMLKVSFKKTLRLNQSWSNEVNPLMFGGGWRERSYEPLGFHSFLSSSVLSLSSSDYIMLTFLPNPVLSFLCVSLRLIRNAALLKLHTILWHWHTQARQSKIHITSAAIRSERECVSVWKGLLMLLFVNTFTPVLQSIDWLIEITSCWGCSVFCTTRGRKYNWKSKKCFWYSVFRCDLVCYRISK